MSSPLIDLDDNTNTSTSANTNTNITANTNITTNNQQKPEVPRQTEKLCPAQVEALKLLGLPLTSAQETAVTSDDDGAITKLILDGLVGGTYDTQSNFIIKNPHLLAVACYAAPYFVPAQGNKLLQLLQDVLQKCNRNILLACSNDIMDALLFLLQSCVRCPSLLGESQGTNKQYKQKQGNE
eukprot:c8830_g2_i1.p1 GENE.c8830_g2_i1~~c8830_g2_i1.p1  ORF type:complete len:182 (-),score=52.13 c8830_g2_i1:76-621(-)